MCLVQGPLQDRAMVMSWVRAVCCHLQHTPPRLLCLPRQVLQTLSFTTAGHITCRVPVYKVRGEGCALWDERGIKPCCHFWATMEFANEISICENLPTLVAHKICSAAQARDPLVLGYTPATPCQAPCRSRSTCHIQAGLGFFCPPQGTQLHNRGRRLQKASSRISTAACRPLQQSETAHLACLRSVLCFTGRHPS